MDPHLSSKSKRFFVFMSKVSGSALTSQENSSSTRKERTHAERKVSSIKVTGPAAGKLTNRSTLPWRSSSTQGLTENHDGLDFLSSL